MRSLAHQLDRYPEHLPGEDRSFGGNEFYVDPLPVGAFFQNVRAITSQSQWKVLREYVKKRADGRCEICGGDTHRLETHERWLFDEQTRKQTLVRLICLCQPCHLGTHWGRTVAIGYADEIRAHILTITGWSAAEFRAHLNERNRAAQQSRERWKLDVSMIESVIPDLKDPGPTVEQGWKLLNAEFARGSIDIGFGQMDLRSEIRKGYVAFLAATGAQALGSMLLSDWQLYSAKPAAAVEPHDVCIPLATFVAAHNNPVVVRYKKDLKALLKERGVPKRLVVNAEWVSKSTVADCFKEAIIFSSE